MAGVGGSAAKTVGDGIPLIDVGPYLAARQPPGTGLAPADDSAAAAAAAVVAQWSQAMEQLGLAVIVGHGKAPRRQAPLGARAVRPAAVQPARLHA